MTHPNDKVTSRGIKGALSVVLSTEISRPELPFNVIPRGRVMLLRHPLHFRCNRKQLKQFTGGATIFFSGMASRALEILVESPAHVLAQSYSVTVSRTNKEAPRRAALRARCDVTRSLLYARGLVANALLCALRTWSVLRGAARARSIRSLVGSPLCARGLAVSALLYALHIWNVLRGAVRAPSVSSHTGSQILISSDLPISISSSCPHILVFHVVRHCRIACHSFRHNAYVFSRRG